MAAVVINSINTKQRGFLETIEGLDACMIVGGTGWIGDNAIPKVLYGDITPPAVWWTPIPMI